jgi:hypothetical protein
MEAVGEASAWSRWQWRRCGVMTGVEEEQACSGGVGRLRTGRLPALGAWTLKRCLWEEGELPTMEKEMVGRGD